MRFVVFFLSISTLFLSSCDKAAKPRKKLAGSYVFYHYELEFFNGHSVSDSTFKMDDVGTLVLNDDKDEWYNTMNFNSKIKLKAWNDRQIYEQNPYWNTDQASMNTINFFVEPNLGNVHYAGYTVKKEKARKLIFTYVAAGTDDKIYYIERLYLKKS